MLDERDEVDVNPPQELSNFDAALMKPWGAQNPRNTAHRKPDFEPTVDLLDNIHIFPDPQPAGRRGSRLAPGSPRYFLRRPERCELVGWWPVRPGMIVAPSRS